MRRWHLVVHEQAIVEVEGVVSSIVHQIEERLISTRINLGGLQMVIDLSV
jgi:hypothetical protein